MDSSVHYKFTHDVSASAFSRTLTARVDEYFRERGVNKHANAEMVFKTVFGVACWIGTWLWLMSGRFSAAGLIAVYVCHGFAQLYMAFNIAHDANHGAYSRHRWVNRVLGYVFDLVGVSSYMWRLFHNSSHHAFVNIRGADTTFISGQVFRFSDKDEARPYHRFQHLYAPVLYSLSTLDWVLTKDVRWLFSKAAYGNRRAPAHPRGEVLMLFAGKAFYFTYMLILPMLYLDAPWYAVLSGFVVMHLFLGFTIALIFQPNHFNAGSAFPSADVNGQISNNHVRHIFDTTADYGRANAWSTWWMGCLNLHVIHHMYAGICHVHYPALTRILISTAHEFGLEYREYPSVMNAFGAHLRWMKDMGRPAVTGPARLATE